MAKVAFLLVPFVVMATEVGLRYLGVLDFPLYENSRELGYIPIPSQRGSYLGHSWAFNDLSMGVAAPFRPSSFERNLLLIGDSGVMGLNSLSQPKKLGSVINANCPQVWPVGADSWALLNELRYLRIHEDLLSKFNRIIFVLNYGDFGDASRWSSEVSHPTHTPISSIAYVLSKLMNAPTPSVPTGDNDWRSEFAWLGRQYSGPITVALWPVRAETNDPDLRRKRLDARKSELGPRVTFIDLYETPNWSANDYRDDYHPSVDGTKKIAAFIVSKIPECQ